MNDLENAFKEIAVEPEQNNNGYKKFNKKSAYTNVVGKNEINLWDNPSVQPLEVSIGDTKTEDKIVVFALPSKTYTLSSDEIEKFKKIAEALAKKGYTARIICSHAKAIHSVLTDAFKDTLVHITPWKGYCKEMTDTKQYLASDANIRAAAHYAKNFQRLPASIKLIKAAAIATMIGLDNDEAATMVIVHDINYDGKKFDFKKSADIVDYYFMGKNFGMNVYNIAKQNDLKDLITVLKD